MVNLAQSPLAEKKSTYVIFGLPYGLPGICPKLTNYNWVSATRLSKQKGVLLKSYNPLICVCRIITQVVKRMQHNSEPSSA